MGFSDTSLCKICPNDHPGKVSSIVRVTLIGSELLFFDSIDVKLAQCTKMKIKVYVTTRQSGAYQCEFENLKTTVYRCSGLV